MVFQYNPLMHHIHVNGNRELIFTKLYRLGQGPFREDATKIKQARLIQSASAR